MMVLLRCTAFLALLVLVTELVGVPSVVTADDLRQSFRIGALRIPLLSYERIPIGTVLAHPDRYQMREIRLTGTVTALQTEVVTNRIICGLPHERTTLTVEDESGQIEVIDQGSCGKNVGALKAPLLTAGQHIHLLVQIMVPPSVGMRDVPVEATIRYIDMAQE